MSKVYTVKCDSPGCEETLATTDGQEGWTQIGPNDHRCPQHTSLVHQIMERIDAGGDLRFMAQNVIDMVVRALDEQMDDKAEIRHTSWHEFQEGGEPIPDLVARLRANREVVRDRGSERDRTTSPSLRDEVADAIRESYRQVGGWPDQADAVLAVVRRHVEALPHPTRAADSQGVLHRDDVLRLLGGGGDE